MLTDGAGIPLAIVVDGANRHDSKLLCATLDGLVIARPAATVEHPQHLCLDAGYDYPLMRLLVRARGYLDHIRSRGKKKAEKLTLAGYRARRWVVEKTQSQDPSDTSIDRTGATPYAWDQWAAEFAYLG